MAGESPLNGTATPVATTQAASESGTIIAVVVVGTVGLCLLGGTFVYVWYMHQRKMREKVTSAPESALETVLRTNAGLVQELQAAHSSRQVDKIEACLEKHKMHVESHRNVQTLLDQTGAFLCKTKLSNLMEQGNHQKEILEKANGELDCCAITDALKQYCKFWEENKMNMQDMAVKEGINWLEQRHCFEEDASLIKVTKDILNKLESTISKQHSLLKSQLRELVEIDDNPVSEVETTLQKYNKFISKHKGEFIKDESLLQIVTQWIENHSERAFAQSRNEFELCLQNGGTEGDKNELQTEVGTNGQDGEAREEELLDSCKSNIKSRSEIDVMDVKTSQEPYLHVNDADAVNSNEINSAQHHEKLKETKCTGDQDINKKNSATIASSLQLSQDEWPLDESTRPFTDLQLHQLVAQRKQLRRNLMKANSDLDELAINIALLEYLNFWQLNTFVTKRKPEQGSEFCSEELELDSELVMRSKRLLSVLKLKLTLEVNLQNELDDDNTTIDEVRLALKKYQSFVAQHKDQFEGDVDLIEHATQWIHRHTSGKSIKKEEELAQQREECLDKIDDNEITSHYREDLNITTDIGDFDLQTVTKTKHDSRQDERGKQSDDFTPRIAEYKAVPRRVADLKENATVPDMTSISREVSDPIVSESTLPYHFNCVKDNQTQSLQKETERTTDDTNVAYLIEQGKYLKLNLEKANKEQNEASIADALEQYLSFYKQNKATLHQLDASSGAFQNNDLREDAGLVALSNNFLSGVKSKLSLELNLRDLITNSTPSVDEVTFQLQKYKYFIQKHNGGFKEDADLVEKVTAWIQNPVHSLVQEQVKSLLQVNDPQTKNVRMDEIFDDFSVQQIMDQNKELKAKVEKANNERDESAITVALTQYLNFRDKNKSVMQRAAPRQGMSWEDYKNELEEDFALVARSKRLLFKTLSQSTFEHEVLKTTLEELTNDDATPPQDVQKALKKYKTFIAKHLEKFEEHKFLIEKVRAWLHKHSSDTPMQDERESFPEDATASVEKEKVRSNQVSEDYIKMTESKGWYNDSNKCSQAPTIKGRTKIENRKEEHQAIEEQEGVKEKVSQSAVVHEALKKTLGKLTKSDATSPKEVEEALQKYKVLIEKHEKELEEDRCLLNKVRAWLQKHTRGTLGQGERKSYLRGAAASNEEEKVKSKQANGHLTKMKVAKEPPEVKEKYSDSKRHEGHRNAASVKSLTVKDGSEKNKLANGLVTRGAPSNALRGKKTKERVSVLGVEHETLKTTLEELMKRDATPPKEVISNLQKYKLFIDKHRTQFGEDSRLVNNVNSWLQKHTRGMSGQNERKSFSKFGATSDEKDKAKSKQVREDKGKGKAGKDAKDRNLDSSRKDDHRKAVTMKSPTLKDGNDQAKPPKGFLAKDAALRVVKDQDVKGTLSHLNADHEALKTTLEELVKSNNTPPKEVEFALQKYKSFIEKNKKIFEGDRHLVNKARAWLQKYTRGALGQDERKSYLKGAAAACEQENVKSKQVSKDQAKVKVVKDVPLPKDKKLYSSRQDGCREGATMKSAIIKDECEQFKSTNGLMTKNAASRAIRFDEGNRTISPLLIEHEALRTTLEEQTKSDAFSPKEVELALQKYKLFIAKNQKEFGEDRCLVNKARAWLQKHTRGSLEQEERKSCPKGAPASDGKEKNKFKQPGDDPEMLKGGKIVPQIRDINLDSSKRANVTSPTMKDDTEAKMTKGFVSTNAALRSRRGEEMKGTMCQLSAEHEVLGTTLKELINSHATPPKEVELALQKYKSFTDKHHKKLEEDKCLINKVKVWLQKHTRDAFENDERNSYPKSIVSENQAKVEEGNDDSNVKGINLVSSRQEGHRKTATVTSPTMKGDSEQVKTTKGLFAKDATSRAGREDVKDSLSHLSVEHEALRATLEELTKRNTTPPEEVVLALKKYKDFIENHQKKFGEDTRLVNKVSTWLQKHARDASIQDEKKVYPTGGVALGKKEQVKSKQNTVNKDLSKVKGVGKTNAPSKVRSEVPKPQDKFVEARGKEERSKAVTLKSQSLKQGTTEGKPSKVARMSHAKQTGNEKDSKLSQQVREGEELKVRLQNANRNLNKTAITEALAKYIHFWETNKLEMQKAAAKDVSLWRNRQHELKEDFQLINCSRNILSKLSKTLEHEGLKGKLQELVDRDGTPVDNVKAALRSYELFLDKNRPEFKKDKSLITKASDWIQRHTRLSGKTRHLDGITTGGHDSQEQPQEDSRTKTRTRQPKIGAATTQNVKYEHFETVGRELNRTPIKLRDGPELDDKGAFLLQKQIPGKEDSTLTDSIKKQTEESTSKNNDEKIEVFGCKATFRNRMTPEEKKFKILRDCLVRAITVLCSTIDEVRKQLNRYTRFHKAHADALDLDSILVSRAEDVILKKEAEINRIKAEGHQLKQLLVSVNEAGDDRLIRERLQAYRDYCKAHPKICLLDTALVDDCLQTLRQKQWEKKDPIEALQAKLLRMGRGVNADEIIAALNAYTQYMNACNLKIDDGMVKKAKEFIYKAKKDECARRLRKAVESADVDKIKEALAEYMNFCNLSLSDTDEHISLVEKANAILNDPTQFSNCVKERELILRDNLLSAHETLNERTVEGALQKYTDFVHQHKASIGTTDNSLLQETDNVLALTREKNAIARAIKGHDCGKLKVALDRLIRMGGEKWLPTEIANARAILKSMERVEKLKVKILQLDRSLMLEIRSYKCPPTCVHDVMKAVLLILGDTEDITSDWLVCRNRCCTVRVGDYPGLLMRIKFFGVRFLHPEIAARALEILLRYTEEEVNRLSTGAAMFHAWALGLCDQCLRMVDHIPTPAVDDRQFFILTIVAREFKAEMEALQKEREEELKAEVVAKWQKRKEGFEKKAVKKWMKKNMNVNYSCSESSDDSGGEERRVFILGTRETLSPVFERSIPDV